MFTKNSRGSLILQFHIHCTFRNDSTESNVFRRTFSFSNWRQFFVINVLHRRQRPFQPQLYVYSLIIYVNSIYMLRPSCETVQYMKRAIFCSVHEINCQCGHFVNRVYFYSFLHNAWIGCTKNLSGSWIGQQININEQLIRKRYAFR